MKRPGGLAGLLLVGPLLLAPGAAADPSPTPVAPEDPLRIVVSELLPRAPLPTDALEVRGTVTNTGATPVTDIRLRLRVGDRVTTRGALHDADVERPVTSSRNATATTPTPEALAPGKGAGFVIRTSVRALGLSGIGVYPLDIEARGNAGDGFHPLGLASTWLPYFGRGKAQPTRVAVVWPLIDRPHQRTNGSFVDDDLTTDLAASGRLGRALAAAATAATPQCERSVQPVTPAAPVTPGTAGTGRPTVAPPRCEPVPVTYALDPDLLQAAGTLAAGKGPAKPAAQAWLTRLRTAVQAGALLALPYGDPDVTAMTRLDSSFKDDLSVDMALSRTAVARGLGAPLLETVAWPPAGVVTPDAADLLSRGGAKAIVLDPSAYPQPDTEPARTPSGRTLLPSSLGPTLQGLVADEQLSRLAIGDPLSDAGPRLAEQRFLAETAVIAFQAPSLSRTLVLAPERRGLVDAAAATAALRDLGRVPWLCPVALAAVATETERCAGRPDVASPKAEDRGPLRTANAGELSPRYLQQVGAERDRAAQLTDAVLTDELTNAAQQGVTELKSELRKAVARAESSYWRADPAGAALELVRLKDDVRLLTGKVVVRGGQVLLTSSRGTLQVSVENTLDVPVKLRVRFRARTLGLQIEPSRLIEVMPKQAVPVSVQATAQKSGQFVVDAELVDRDGQVFGKASTVYVRSTRYGRLAIGLTVAGAGVLLATAGLRLVRRALRRTASAPR